MNIIIAKSKEEFSEFSANQVVMQLKEKKNSTITFATGNTPVGTYEHLVSLFKEGKVDFSEMRAFNLDEFIGVERTNKSSYNTFLRSHLYDLINVKPGNTFPMEFIMNSEEETRKRFEEALKQFGGIDFAILGIGMNGHIGYNEPGTPLDSLTHVVDLTESTRIANSDLFDSLEDVPKKGVTMGIKTIMNARKIMLLANGEKKAEIIHKALQGPITTEVPASILQLHPNVVVVLDEAAAKYIK